MQQVISDIQDFSVIKHKDKNWVKLALNPIKYTLFMDSKLKIVFIEVIVFIIALHLGFIIINI